MFRGHPAGAEELPLGLLLLSDVVVRTASQPLAAPGKLRLGYDPTGALTSLTEVDGQRRQWDVLGAAGGNAPILAEAGALRVVSKRQPRFGHRSPVPAVSAVVTAVTAAPICFLSPLLATGGVPGAQHPLSRP